MEACMQKIYPVESRSENDVSFIPVHCVERCIEKQYLKRNLISFYMEETV